MEWQGRISGSDGVWGNAGAARLIAVSDEGVVGQQPRNIPAKLLPEAVIPHADHRETERIDLGPIADLGGRDRLALIGFQHLNPHWDGVAIILRDRVTQWATLSAGELIHLQASATPQIVQALGLGRDDGTRIDPALMAQALDRPERLLLLLHEAQGNAAKLGVLLGAEIGATRTLWLGQQAVLIGEGPLVQGYAKALQAAHVPVTLTDHPALLHKGFQALAATFDHPE